MMGRNHRRLAGAICALVAALCVATSARADAAAEHLRFFKQNRDFLLRAIERLGTEATAPGGARRSWDFDPFAEWSAQARMDAVRAALDTAAAPEHLGSFRAALDSLLAEAEAAAARLDTLDQRFAAHLRTAVEVTLATGKKVRLQRVEARLDGEPVMDRALSPEERAALDAGGILEVLRRVVEVRPQTLEVRLWVDGDPEPRLATHVIAPVPDAVVRVHLDLAGAEAPKPVESVLGGG
jgi:hypothetical protein